MSMSMKPLHSVGASGSAPTSVSLEGVIVVIVSDTLMKENSDCERLEQKCKRGRAKDAHCARTGLQDPPRSGLQAPLRVHPVCIAGINGRHQHKKKEEDR